MASEPVGRMSVMSPSSIRISVLAPTTPESSSMMRVPTRAMGPDTPGHINSHRQRPSSLELSRPGKTVTHGRERVRAGGGVVPVSLVSSCALWCEHSRLPTDAGVTTQLTYQFLPQASWRVATDVRFGLLAAAGNQILSVCFCEFIADGYYKIQSFRIFPSLTRQLPQSGRSI